MIELLNTLGGLISALGNVQSVDVMKQHIALLQAQLELVTKQVVALEKQNAELVQQKAELEKQLARHAVSDEYVEHRGALFKRKAGGGYIDQPVCPRCKSAMNCFHDAFPFQGGNQNCKQETGFTGAKLAKVMAELP